MCTQCFHNGETWRPWSCTRPSPKTIRCSLDLPCLLALCLPWMARAPRIMSSWIWHDSTVYIKPQQVSFTNASLSWTTVISDYWHPLHIPLVRTIDACRCMQVRPVPSSTFHVVPYLSYVLNVSMMYPKAALQIRQGLNICRLPLELMASAEPGPQSTPYGRFPSSRWLKNEATKYAEKTEKKVLLCFSSPAPRFSGFLTLRDRSLGSWVLLALQNLEVPCKPGTSTPFCGGVRTVFWWFSASRNVSAPRWERAVTVARTQNAGLQFWLHR